MLRISILALSMALAACATTSGDEKASAMPETTAAQQAPAPATPAARAAMEQRPPLERATFWTREYELNPADKQAATEFSRALRQIGNPEKAASVAEPKASSSGAWPG